MDGTNSSEQRPPVAAPWRRIAAYLVDYVVFIVPLLGVLGLTSVALSIDALPSNAWLKHGLAIFVLTLPIVLYFAVLESSRWQATVGKRLLRVEVVDFGGSRATFDQTLVRAIVKFLPWEFFHTIYWHWDGWPLNPAPPTNLQLIGLVFGWIVIFIFLGSLFVGSRRTPYDRIAGTIVVIRTNRETL